jgi:hypothetical protein
MYKHESKPGWHWFESYDMETAFTKPYFVLIWLQASDLQRNSKIFRFFIIKTITENSIKVISNKGWLHNNQFIQVMEANNPLM